MQTKFQPGQIVATSHLIHDLSERYGDEGGTQLMLTLMLRRHLSGDWGDVCAQDARANEQALKNGERLLSVYHPEPEQDPNFKVYVITEWDRSATTIMLAEDY